MELHAYVDWNFEVFDTATKAGVLMDAKLTTPFALIQVCIGDSRYPPNRGVGNRRFAQRAQAVRVHFEADLISGSRMKDAFGENSAESLVQGFTVKLKETRETRKHVENTGRNRIGERDSLASDEGGGNDDGERRVEGEGGRERNQLESKGFGVGEREKKKKRDTQEGEQGDARQIEKEESPAEEVINGNEDCLAKCEWPASGDMDGTDGWMDGWMVGRMSSNLIDSRRDMKDPDSDAHKSKGFGRWFSEPQIPKA
ncbi:hypothetical protein WN55_08298 [Dufourea novaeangliae]|uniref:Uncharacterized protein n=1 Tax=Dufourea novaeangliae TaxID=178035 RepID=A0A154P6M8_DUFNO|nr:hypothetical protein WN55_08298 [Dufourea novaeangliae]